jgi:hypothetical protein
VVDAAPGLTRPRLRPYWTPPYGGSELSVGWSPDWDAICLTSDVPVRAWRLKQTILTRPWSRPIAFGKSFNCLLSFWGRRRLRPALSPLSSPGTLDTGVGGTQSNGIIRDEQACGVRKKAYSVRASQRCSRDADRLEGTCQLLHGGNTDRERRKVRYARIDRRSSDAAIWHKVARDERRDRAVRDRSGQ